MHADSAFIDQVSDHDPLLLTPGGIPTPVPELAAVMPCCPAVDVGRVGAGGAQGTAHAPNGSSKQESRPIGLPTLAADGQADSGCASVVIAPPGRARYSVASSSRKAVAGDPLRTCARSNQVPNSRQWLTRPDAVPMRSPRNARTHPAGSAAVIPNSGRTLLRTLQQPGHTGCRRLDVGFG